MGKPEGLFCQCQKKSTNTEKQNFLLKSQFLDTEVWQEVGVSDAFQVCNFNWASDNDESTKWNAKGIKYSN